MKEETEVDIHSAGKREDELFALVRQSEAETQEYIYKHNFSPAMAESWAEQEDDGGID